MFDASSNPVFNADFNAAFNLRHSVLAVDTLNDGFMVQRASVEDLPKILAIYNQSIAGKQATANLTPVTCEERTDWFEEHLNNKARPIYVVKAVIHATVEATQSTQYTEAPIIAWGSFSDLYARTAYHISTEISIYLHRDYHGRGLGSLLTRWMIAQAPSLGIHNVVALIFAHNQPSLGLFRKLGFEQWGYMPKVCDMQGFIADVVMLGKAVTTNQMI
ncbi:MAG: N-acetyltransferase family protein [Psychrobacter sp.]|nr:N-acetyltransferase family protein [Psychrobacter sp.]